MTKTASAKAPGAPMDLKDAMDLTALSKTHWKVWFLSSMGIFLDGFDLFIISVALPLLNLYFTDMSPVLQGEILAATPIGCIFGALVFGRLTDRLGRRAILLFDLLFFVVFAGMSALAWDPWSLVLFRFLLGIGIGADYPVSSSYITENMPKRLRGKMMVCGFGFQALGAITAAVLGAIIFFIHPSPSAWRIMLGIAVIPAVVILGFRLTLPESPRWLLHHGKREKAEEIATKMTGKRLKVEALEAAEESSFLDLFTPRYIKRTTMTALSWLIMDIGLYGINLFVPVLLIKLAITKHTTDTHGTIANVINQAIFIDIFLVVGVVFAIFLVERWGRIKLQSIGFFGMACGLFLVAAATGMSPDSTLYIITGLAGLMLFNTMVNLGPNPITYLLPAEVFPTHLRATGHGFAAASGKLGAAIGGLCIPIIIAHFNTAVAMLTVGAACLVGFVITLALGNETKGKSLDDISAVEKTMDSAEVSLLHVQQDITRLHHDLKSVETALARALSEIKKLREK